MSKSDLIAHARRMAAKGAPGAAEALAALEGSVPTDPFRLASRDLAGEADAIRSAPMALATPRSFAPRGWLKLRLPWSTLLPDNEKWVPVLGRNNKPKLLLTEPYRERKARIEAVVREQVGDAPPFTVPVRLEARVYEPDRRVRRDIGNFGKLVQDALTAIAYADDSLIDDLRWIRAGVDIDAPRVEIHIQPL